MEKIYLRDVNDNQMEVEFVRFFHFKNTNYLIYTKNEVDEKGYVLLYPVKIMESLGEKIARSIKDETEWENMQSIVTKVIKEIKDEKIESFIDLDKNELENLKIVDSRFFKLDPKLVEILASSNVLGIEKNINLDEFDNTYGDFLFSNNIEEKDNINEIGNDISIDSNNINIVANDEQMVNEEIDTSIAVDNNLENIVPNTVSETGVGDSIWQDKVDDNVQDDISSEKMVIKSENDYKAMYEEVLKEKDELSDILSNMVIELTNYKIKFGELPEENN